MNSVCASTRAYNTSKAFVTKKGTKDGPDITLYPLNRLPPAELLASFQHMELFVEFNSGSTSDPFDVGDAPFPRSSPTTRASLEQMVWHVTRIQMYQFRTSFFSVGIFGNVARLFRWDRSGSIVSKPIMLTEKGNRELSEFFYRFNLADSTQRGWDPTVSEATPEETAAFDQAVDVAVGEGKNKLFKRLFGSVGDVIRYSRKKVEVIHPSGRQTSYIVGRSTVSPEVPTGRCTRGFVAMDTDTRMLVFLKDSWRPNAPGVKSESHWHRIVQGTRNVAVFSHGSDVGKVVPRRGVGRGVKPQLTISQNDGRRYCGIAAMMGHIHYRTIQCEFYLPLNTFRDSRQLAEVMYDVVLGAKRLLGSATVHHSFTLLQQWKNFMKGGSFIEISATTTL